MFALPRGALRAPSFWCAPDGVIGRPWRALVAAVVALLLVSIAVPLEAAAQDSVVAGIIVDERALKPLADAEVAIVATTRRTHTDAGGWFRFESVAGTEVTLQVRRLGYRMLVRPVRVGERSLRFVLRETAVTLDAVIVTGTPGGTQARAIGNAVTRTTVAEVIQAAPAADVQDVLMTRVPGLTVMPTQGNVGTGAVIRIRGVTSLFLPNDPLLYVDGVRVDNNTRAGPYIRGGSQVSRLGDIDPEEIETIEVIKGPAAATLYGTEASRGVIQILTHRGVEGPPRFGLTVRQGANWFRNPADRLNWVFARDSDVVAHKVRIDSTTGRVLLDSVNLYQQEVDAGRPIFSTGQPRGYALNVSGGTSAVRYYASGEYDRAEGVVPYDWRNRASGRVNLSLLASENLDIESSVALVRNNMRLGQMTSVGAETGWDPMTQLNWGTPLTVNSPLRGFARATPEAIATVEDRSNTDRVMGSVRVRHHPWRWFSERLTAGTDVGDETSSVLFPTWAPGPNPADTVCSFQDFCSGDKTVNGRHVALSSLDYVGSISSPVDAGVRSITSVGAQYYHKRVETTEEYGHGFPVGVSAVSGAAQTSSKEDVIEDKGGGIFVQEQLGWKNRRFLTGALRADDNSAFGANFDFVTYPKVSASWVLNEERFWRRMRVFDALKLRAAWGMAGRQPDAFAAERTYQPVSGPGGTSTLTPQNVGNPDLRPERGQEIELGFDAGLFRDRVSATFTYYRQNIKDAIVPRVLAPSDGFPGSQLVNLGEVRNSGLELSLDSRLVESHAFAWDLGVSYSTNDSRVVSLGGLEPINLIQANNLTNFLNFQWHVEGYPVGAFFAPVVVSNSITANGNAVNIMCATGVDGRGPPALCDGSAGQRVYLGRPTPTWSGSVRTTVTLLGRLKLYALVDFRGGNVVYSADAASAHGSTGNSRVSRQRADSLYLAYDALRVQGLGGNFGLGALKGGFAKLREVSLTYTLPEAWAARFGARSAALTVAGRNLAILWRAQKDVWGYKIVDPEMRGPVDLSGLVLNEMPPFTQVMTALRLTF